MSVLSFVSASRNVIVEIEGTIHSYGNAPFNYPGIVTVDGKNFAVYGNIELKQLLLEHQGELLKFEGYIINREDDPVFALKDGSFEVVKWKSATKKNKKK